MHWQSVVDFLVLAIALYLLLRWSSEARALRLALTILAFRVGAPVSRQLDLLITSWVLDIGSVVGVLALVIVFQPELRRALMRFDLVERVSRQEEVTAVPAVAAAAWSLARSRCGALIVLARNHSLSELTTPGVALKGQVSPDILVAIFQKQSPVHDGAAIIEGDAITRVGAILPLTSRSQIPEHYGTRHRAAMGLTERSDAVVIVVSEERGEVTLMWENQARVMAGVDALSNALTPLISGSPRTLAFSLRRLRSREIGRQAAAVGLATLVWSVTFLFPGRSVQVRTVPVELTNVPSGLTVAGQSIDTLQVWLRGNQFLFETVDLGTLVAHCDLSAAHQGLNLISLDAAAVDVPFGVKVETMTPRQVQVSLVSRP